MADTRAIFKFVTNFNLLFNIAAILQYGGHARFLDLTLTCYCNKVVIFKYGGLARF